MNSDEIIKEFNDNVSKFDANILFHHGTVVGVLKKCCHSDGDYRLVLKVLTGKTSSKEISEAQFHALYKFVLPFKPVGGKWKSQRGDYELESMCNALVNLTMEQPGQMKFA